LPIELPTPIKPQARKSVSGSVAKARAVRPAAKARFPQGNTLRPPNRSIARPILGPKSPDSNNEKVKAQKKSSVVIPIEAEIGTARIAGM
jgi:hypothetical protein